MTYGLSQNLALSHLFETALSLLLSVTFGGRDILFCRIGPDSPGGWLSSSNSWGCFKKKCLEICGVHEQIVSWKSLLKFPLLETEVDRTQARGPPPPPQYSWASFSFHSSPALENPSPCLNTGTKQTHAEAICV